MNARARTALMVWSGFAGCAFLISFAVICWFYFYSADIPHFSDLPELSPDSAATIPSTCSATSARVIPAASIPNNLRFALRAAEGAGDQILAMQISRNLFCSSQVPRLKRELLEYKAAIQIRRRFTPEQLVTIYLNQVPFGQDLVGVENASLHYYGKHASELDLPQAALIAGLIKAPSIYSPEQHPDRAKERRDAVIEKMQNDGAINAEQAQAAENAPLR